jgi:hypothetical protein
LFYGIVPPLSLGYADGASCRHQVVVGFAGIFGGRDQRVGCWNSPDWVSGDNFIADDGSYTLQMHCSIVIVFLKYPT